jgi:polyphosphate kinase
VPATLKSSKPWFRCAVSSPDLLRRLATHPLPLGLRSGATTRAFHRDIYFDAPDGTLQARGVACRIRIRDDDRRVLTVVLNGAAGRERFEADTDETDPRRILDSDLEPARRLRAVLDPARLRAELELETERLRRSGRAAWWPLARFAFIYDVATVRRGAISRSFQEVKVYRLGAGPPSLDKIALALEREHGLRLLLADKRERARLILSAMENEVGARSVDTGRAVALVAVESGRAAFRQDAESLRIPVREGSGEAACRRLLQESLGSGVGNLHLLGTVAARDRRYTLEVWLARQVRASGNGSIEWIPLDQLDALVGSSALRDPDTRAALLVAARAGALGEAPVERRHSGPSTPVTAPETTTNDDLPPGRWLDADIGLLAFNTRVLELAEDASAPLLERLRYIAIVGSNLDEFFMVRVGAIKHGDRDVEGEGVGKDFPTDARLEPIAVEARTLVARQYRVLAQALAELETHGVRLRRWSELGPEQRAFLRSFFEEQVFPLLTPKAITLAPGHPFPRIPHLSLGIGIMTRDQRTGPVHFAHLEVPREVPRWIELPEGNAFAPVEDIVRARLDRIFRDRVVDSASMFRVTRSAELNVEEESAGNLLQAMEEGATGRRRNAVVRVEVEREMSAEMRDRLQRELRFEPGGAALPLRSNDIYEADGPLALRDFTELADLPIPELRFPPLHPRAALAAERSIWDILRERDVLVHHPYDDFDGSVLRFFTEAADDPDVAAIKLTLYRAGSRSPIVDALVRAAEQGKKVAAFVELKARFDEERNISSARQLERAGVHVVHGIVGLKNHAKIALVTRRESGAIRHYAHIGTGNYNASTARAYTDLGLLTADESIGLDLADLFNQLTGTTHGPTGPFRSVLVAPNFLLPTLLAHIERETEHAQAGRPARIRAKLNGLSDAKVVDALYRASRAGVEIDLIVRSLCTLRPGVPDLSERIRVISGLGRFLEHARIYHFANGGEDEYYIGSADWRPRNLRRRVEVVTPVRDSDARTRLDRILDLELANPTAWELRASGEYVRRSGADGPGVQDRLVMETAGDAAPVS